MIPGINSFAVLAADVPVAASATLVDVTGLGFNLPAGKTVIFEAWVPFSTGATGGFKFQLTNSQVPQDYKVSFTAVDGTAAVPGSEFSVTQVTQAAFANAWAVAGNHYLKIEGKLTGHATLADTVQLQVACNSAANAITALKGAWLKLTQLN